jgi:hypothetical protein
MQGAFHLEHEHETPKLEDFQTRRLRLLVVAADRNSFCVDLQSRSVSLIQAFVCCAGRILTVYLL